MITFPCGCTFKKNDKGRPIFNPDIKDLPLDCTRTWDMICEGNTKGVFQLESQLGQSKAKQVKPRSIQELSDLIAIIRPGTSDVIVDGKSLTQHYIDRKSGKDEVKIEYPELSPVLSKTYGILCYQEQAMRIAQIVAGFDLQQADTLRKAIGKKKVDLMAQVKKDFIDGSERLGKFGKKDAEKIFSWIEASQRYSFNKCLCPNSVVDTPNGEKLLSEVKIGDKVLAPKDNENNEFVEILDVIDSGEKEVYEIELDNGNTLRCTLEHKILCSDGMKHTLKEILEKDLSVMVY